MTFETTHPGGCQGRRQGFDQTAKVYHNAASATSYKDDPNSGAKVADEEPTPETVKIRVNLFTNSRGILTKRINRVENGAGIIKDASCCLLIEGAVQTLKLTLPELAERLRHMKANEALCLSNIERKETRRVLSRKRISDEDRKAGVVCRDGEHFPFEKGIPCFILVDGDPSAEYKADSVDDFIATLNKALPSFSQCAMVITHSTSSHIYDGDRQLTGIGGFHLFVAVQDAAELLPIEEFRRRILTRFWLAGLGWIFIDRAGRMHPRCPIDTAVFSSERLIFEGSPELEEGLSSRRPLPAYRSGGWLKVDKIIPPFTSEEEACFDALVAEAKRAKASEARKTRAVYEKQEIDKLVKTGKSASEARSIVKNRLRGILVPGDRLHLDDGREIDVREVLLDPAAFDDETLADPLEPDYQGAPGSITPGKAKLFAHQDEWPDQGPVIHSYAHGGRLYRLKFDAPSLLDWIEQTEPPARLLAQWADVMALHTGFLNEGLANHVIAAVKKKTDADKRALGKDLNTARARAARRLAEERAEVGKEELPAAPVDIEAERQRLFEQCKDIAVCLDILARVETVMRRRGVVGETSIVRLVYLQMTSRVLDKPISVKITGSSASGKSYVSQSVLDLFPESAFYLLTAGSSKSLIYSPEPIAHRIIVLLEANALIASDADDANIYAMVLRTLLSEGRIVYEVTVPGGPGEPPTTAKIIKEGPAGLLVTTTAALLHAENETRMLTVASDDSSAQTREVLRSIASRPDGLDPEEVERWQAFQAWIALGPTRVHVPYAHLLAELMVCEAVRVRRDFAALLSLIQSSAILHQQTRERDENGRIVASLADYATVRPLVAEMVAEESGIGVSEQVRLVVKAIHSEVIKAWRLDAPRDPERIPDHEELTRVGVTLSRAALAKATELSSSAVKRAIDKAAEHGFLMLQSRGNAATMYFLDQPLPSTVGDALPTVEALERAMQQEDAAQHTPAIQEIRL